MLKPVKKRAPKSKRKDITEADLIKNPRLLVDVEEQTPELVEAAVKSALDFYEKNGRMMFYLAYIAPEFRTLEICEKLVRINPLDIDDVPGQPIDLCKLAIELDATSIEYIRNPSEELIKLAAVKEASYLDMLGGVAGCSESTAMELFEENMSVIRYIKYPTDAMVSRILDEDPLLFVHVQKRFLKEELRRKAVEADPENIQFFPHDPSLIKIALSKNFSVIDFTELIISGYVISAFTHFSRVEFLKRLSDNHSDYTADEILYINKYAGAFKGVLTHEQVVELIESNHVTYEELPEEYRTYKLAEIYQEQNTLEGLLI